MKLRKAVGLLALLLCLGGLTGCVFGSVDEMYALPKSSESYVNLQATINQEKGSAEYIAPLSGENRQTIQLVDVDGDGSQEAVAFFRDAAAEQPLQIVIFKQDDREAYQVYARIEGIGSEIESIDYLDLCGDTGCDILVSWQVSASVHTLVGYTIAGGEPMEILRSGYGRYLAADLDKDGREELVLAQSENGSPARWRLEYYDGRESHMEMLSAAPLSEGATDICAWSSGSLADETPGLFVTSYFGKDVLITDVLCVDEGGLRNLSLHSGKRSSENTCHYYSGVFPADMNGDGITEVPVSREVPAYGGSTADSFWWLDWIAYRSDGSGDQVLTTCHSGDGWYLELPEEWTGDFSMCRQESSATGVRSVTFARGLDTEETDPQPFLTICTLTGSDRGELARQDGWFILYTDSNTICTGEFLPGWDCGLDQDGLESRFHHSTGGWSHGST